MALQINIELNSGITVEGAYLRIGELMGNKDNLMFQLDSYVSRESFQEGKQVLQQEAFYFSPSTEEGSFNYHKQGYEHLKTLPEFEGAIDVLE